MKLKLVRDIRNSECTIGKLYVDGVYLCDTLEDVDRGLTDKMSIEEIKSKKIQHETAIPSGEYIIDLKTISPRFSKSEYLNKVCGGKLPRLLNVKGFDGVLIHTGNHKDNTDGCILVGKRMPDLKSISDSKMCFENLYGILKASFGEIKIEIK